MATDGDGSSGKGPGGPKVESVRRPEGTKSAYADLLREIEDEENVTSRYVPTGRSAKERGIARQSIKELKFGPLIKKRPGVVKSPSTSTSSAPPGKHGRSGQTSMADIAFKALRGAANSIRAPGAAQPKGKTLLRTDIDIDPALRGLGISKVTFLSETRSALVDMIDELLDKTIAQRQLAVKSRRAIARSTAKHHRKMRERGMTAFADKGKQRKNSPLERAWTKNMTTAYKAGLTVHSKSTTTVRVDIDRRNKTAIMLERGYRARSLWDILRNSKKLKRNKTTGQVYIDIPLYVYDASVTKTAAGAAWLAASSRGIQQQSPDNLYRTPGRKRFTAHTRLSVFNYNLNTERGREMAIRAQDVLARSMHMYEEGARIFKRGRTIRNEPTVSKRMGARFNVYRGREEYIGGPDSHPLNPKTGKRSGHAVSFMRLSEEKMRSITVSGLKGLRFLRTIKKQKNKLINRAANRARRVITADQRAKLRAKKRKK